MKEHDKYHAIFKAISLSCNPTVPINNFGYASPSIQIKPTKYGK